MFSLFHKCLLWKKFVGHFEDGLGLLFDGVLFLIETLLPLVV